MASNGDDSPSQENGGVVMRGQRKDNDNTAAASALARGMAALHENGDGNEGLTEIKKLDSQLDHLNDYLTKVGEKIDTHQIKLQETLNHQKEERLKRRQSFQERIASSQQEDATFQNQMQEMFDRLAAQRAQTELNAQSGN